MCDIPSRLSIGARTPYSFGQYLDPRCFVEGREYLIEAWGRPIPVDDSNSASSALCSEGTLCPEMGIVFVSNDGYSWIEYLSDQSRSGSNDNIFTHDALEGRRQLSVTDDGYTMLVGALEVTPEIASASSAFFFIDRNDLNRDVKFCVDDVKLTQKVIIQIG